MVRDSITRTINPSKWTCLNTVRVNSINGLESCFSVNFVIWLFISDVFSLKNMQRSYRNQAKCIFSLIRWCCHVPEENQYVQIYIPDNINKQLRLVKLYGRLYVAHYYIREIFLNYILNFMWYTINHATDRPTKRQTKKRKDDSIRDSCCSGKWVAVGQTNEWKKKPYNNT